MEKDAKRVRPEAKCDLLRALSANSLISLHAKKKRKKSVKPKGQRSVVPRTGL